MIAPEELFEQLKLANISFFTGVPDSLLKSFCAYVTENAKKGEHVVAANEGGAIALAAGHYLATGEYALVYMQNSGLGNAVNPLLSLADTDVYSIPMLLMIGWRGKPGHRDEPQHVKQGRVTLKLLDAMEIPHYVLDGNMANWQDVVNTACYEMKARQGPVAIVVRKGTFERHQLKAQSKQKNPLTREDAIGIVVDGLVDGDLVVSTTGMASRELFELRDKKGQSHDSDFLTVGSMGHSSQIALGVALAKSDKQVFCIDGDGSVLMHTGGLAIIGQLAPKNFKHILINNEAHDSVGGQPTASPNVDYVNLALSMGYKLASRAVTCEEARNAIRNMREATGPCLLEIRVRRGARKDLGRPTLTPIEIKDNFTKELAK